jgi:hypothetical protein
VKRRTKAARSEEKAEPYNDAALALALLLPGQVGLSCGIPGGGKTHTVSKAMALKLMQDPAARDLVFDPYARRDRSNWARGVQERKPWWPEHPLYTVTELLRRPQLLDVKPLRMVVCGHNGTLNPQELGRDFSTLAELLWLTGGVNLIGEESGIYGRSAVELINRIATGGAHAGMALTLICQSLSRVPKDGRAGITLISAGPQGEPSNFDDLRERCGPAFVERVRALPDPRAQRAPPVLWRLGDATTQESSK